jgi:hypothetical protein
MAGNSTNKYGGVIMKSYNETVIEALSNTCLHIELNSKIIFIFMHVIE